MDSEWDGTAWAGSDIQTRAVLADELADLSGASSLQDFYARFSGSRTTPYRLPSIRDALGVPAIQRCVTIISNTTGMLPVQGFRNGRLMPEPPRVITRPNPYQTQRDFYRDWAYAFATRGDAIHFVANTDDDGYPSALYLIPPQEVTVESDPRNRLFPKVRWGTIEGTWWSPINRTGRFVHSTYLSEPGALRGVGPLQMAQAAVSVSVESQEWAANFYSGGNSSTIIKHAAELSPQPDEDGYNEAQRLKNQWVTGNSNTPKVIDQTIERVETLPVNPQGAQMLDAREHQNGEAARMFGVPGALVEYNASGSSLTYQNVTEVYREFLTTCLDPNYLEPIRQTLGDLMPRSTTADFYREILLRADVKTRYEVYSLGIPLGVIPLEDAQKAEGYLPGNPEVMPIPFAPSASVPGPFPQLRTVEGIEVRCDGVHSRRVGGISKVVRCGRLLSKTGTFVGRCPRCKKDHSAAA